MDAILITGASAGIGEAFARQLAAEGHNLVLAARRVERLRELAETLEASFKIQVVSLRCDLTEENAAKTLAGELDQQGIRVSGLINNAGFGDRGRFQDLPLERQLNMIQLNVTALVDLTGGWCRNSPGRSGPLLSMWRPPPLSRRAPIWRFTTPPRRSYCRSARRCTKSCAGRASR